MTTTADWLVEHTKRIKERANARSVLIVFFVLTIAFCLTSNIFRSTNSAIGIFAHATKSWGSSVWNSNDRGSSGGGSTTKSNEEKVEKQGSRQERQQVQQQRQLEQQEQTQLKEQEQQQFVHRVIPGPNPNWNSLISITPVNPFVPPTPPPGTPLPPLTCEQRSTSPECQKAPEPPGPSVDCTKNPNDPACTSPPCDPTKEKCPSPLCPTGSHPIPGDVCRPIICPPSPLHFGPHGCNTGYNNLVANKTVAVSSGLKSQQTSLSLK